MFAVIAVIGIAFWHSWSSLFDVWGNRPGYSHGYLVPLISLWLLYTRRDALDAVEPRPAPLMLLPIAVLGLLWVVVALASIQIGHQMLVPVIAWLAVFALAGKTVARICLLPFAYLYLAMPIWGHIQPGITGADRGFDKVPAGTRRNFVIYRRQYRHPAERSVRNRGRLQRLAFLHRQSRHFGIFRH